MAGSILAFASFFAAGEVLVRSRRAKVATALVGCRHPETGALCTSSEVWAWYWQLPSVEEQTHTAAKNLGLSALLAVARRCSPLG